MAGDISHFRQHFILAAKYLFAKVIKMMCRARHSLDTPYKNVAAVDQRYFKVYRCGREVHLTAASLLDNNADNVITKESKMASDPTKQWETLAAAATRVGCDPSRLRQLALAGKLTRAVKFGRNWFVPRGLKIILDKHSR